MKKNYYLILYFLFPLILFPYNSHSSNLNSIPSCDVSEQETAYFLQQVENNNKPPIRAMDDCKKSNHKLFAKIINLNPDYFEFASDSLRDDEVFISKFVAINPTILKYISTRLSEDKFFIFKMTKFYPEALRYASPKLTDNKNFINKMLEINPKNFIYASERLQDDKNTALKVMRESGKMLKFTSDRLKSDREVVKEAIKSYSLAINFSDERLQKDRELKKLSSKINYNFLDNFSQFLKENYGGLGVGPDGFRGYHIVNMAKMFPEKQILYQPYTTKWLRVYNNGAEKDVARLSAKSNEEVSWKIAFSKYSNLAKNIEDIFKLNQVDQNTIDALNAISIWEISNKPKVIAFELYLLRKIDNKYLNDDVSNVTSLTAIANQVKNGKKSQWEINVVDAVFDADLKMDIMYKNGHKRYRIWDAYRINKKDKIPKILFKVEDKDGEYFDLFVKQINNRYASIYKGGGYATEIISY